MTGGTKIGTPTSPTSGPNPAGPRGPQRRRRRLGVIGVVIVVVVIVVIAGVFGYLYVNHALPGQSKVGGCSKSTAITVWQDFSATEFPAFSKAIAQFETENPGETVNYVNDSSPSPSNYVAAALSCTAPDILIGSSDFAGCRGSSFTGWSSASISSGIVRPGSLWPAA